jgi:hypothetical protein
MTSDLTSIEQEVAAMPPSDEGRDLIRLIAETRELDREVELMVSRDREREAKQRRDALQFSPFLIAILAYSGWRLFSAFTTGQVTVKAHILSAASDPVSFAFLLIFPTVGVLVSVVGLGVLAKLYLRPGPNPRFEGTAEKLRFSVPRRLRRRAAPQAKRWAS